MYLWFKRIHCIVCGLCHWLTSYSLIIVSNNGFVANFYHDKVRFYSKIVCTLKYMPK